MLTLFNQRLLDKKQHKKMCNQKNKIHKNKDHRESHQQQTYAPNKVLQLL